MLASLCIRLVVGSLMTFFWLVLVVVVENIQSATVPSSFLS